MSDKKSRFERRLAERRAERNQDAPSTPPVEKPSVEERRVRSLTSAEVSDWLKRNGIVGEDKRKAPRRKR